MTNHRAPTDPPRTDARGDHAASLPRDVDRGDVDRREAVEQPPATATRDAAGSGELLRLVVETLREDAIVALDPRGHVATWNAGAERILGYAAGEIVGRHCLAFYAAAEAGSGGCEHELARAARDGRFADEGWRLRKDGSRFWACVTITARRDDAGALLGFGLVLRDLTAPMLADQRLRDAEKRNRLLIESVKDYAIFGLDANGHVTSWNPGAERIKGYRADEILGSHFSRFYPEEDVRSGKCDLELEQAERTGRFEDEGWRVRKDGSRFWANVVISAVRDEHGTLVGFSKVTRDLTERRRNEEERAARLAAEQANRTKDDFLAVLGHELRNPLAPIFTALQLLKLRGDESSIREHQVIERQVHQMSRLVDDLLDVSRIARGKIVLHKRRIDVRDVLARAAEIAIPLIESKQQHFEVDVPPRELHVLGDDARLVQVFANLLNNASKYTPSGGNIWLAVRPTAQQVVVQVRDDGKGISEELLPRVFELFVQGYQDAARAEGGLGLGLTLVRSLVEMHGGAVEVHSPGIGKGSLFVVRLPVAAEAVRDPDTRDAAGEPAAEPSGSIVRRVLIVDDNDDARLLLRELLALLGHDVEAVGDGETALARLPELRPEVVILDIGLPGMDGYELAARIRALPGGARIQLIAVTGYGGAAEQERGRAAGIDVHLVKPVDVQGLLRHVVA